MININKELKQSIILSVLSKKHSLENIINLSRCVYNELNVRINYDYTWLYDQNFKMEDNFDKKITFSDLINNKTSCNSWSQLFKELLIEFGVPESDISIKSEKLKHKWVDINLDDYNNDKILRIDGTTNYFGNQDIYNCKVNNNTSGFLILDKNFENYSLEQLYKTSKISKVDIEEHGILYNHLNEILGFYGIELFEILNNCIDSSNGEQLLYEMYQTLDNFIKTNKNFVVNGSDLCKFLKHNPQTKKFDVEFLAYYDQGYIETCCKVTQNKIVLFYSESGAVLLNTSDYDKYVSNLNFVKKK